MLIKTVHSVIQELEQLTRLEEVRLGTTTIIKEVVLPRSAQQNRLKELNSMRTIPIMAK
jgi:hypothetical protein